jgi:hypothetical protein
MVTEVRGQRSAALDRPGTCSDGSGEEEPELKDVPDKVLRCLSHVLTESTQSFPSLRALPVQTSLLVKWKERLEGDEKLMKHKGLQGRW